LVLAPALGRIERSVLDSASAGVRPEIESDSVVLDKVNELRNLSLRRVAGRGLKLCLLSVVEGCRSRLVNERGRLRSASVFVFWS
jgi:hypothetical protein